MEKRGGFEQTKHLISGMKHTILAM
uniref:Uncharacterized protein n=1 Tax=Rhizophora mucronata TaxID=61149 RepID=A0A2P2PSL5_RHIMU